MNEAVGNPYSSPESDVAPEAVPENSFGEFPRFSAWWVFLLSVITLGIYTYYWLFTRTTVINRQLPDNQISNTVVWGTITVAVLSWISSLGSTLVSVGGTAAGNTLLAAAGLDFLLSVAGFVFWLLWAFAIRGRINQMTGAQPGNSLWSNGILTFFFTPVYPAYKINQIKDSYANVR